MPVTLILYILYSIFIVTLPRFRIVLHAIAKKVLQIQPSVLKESSLHFFYLSEGNTKRFVNKMYTLSRVFYSC